jgi:hypothetical protein
MTKSKPTNMAASVRARLLNISKESGDELTYTLTRYGLERRSRVSNGRRIVTLSS